MVVHIMYYYQSGGNLLGVAVNMEVEPHKLHLGE